MKTLIILLVMATTAFASEPSTFNRYVGTGNAQKSGRVLQPTRRLSRTCYDHDARQQQLLQSARGIQRSGNAERFRHPLYDRQGISQGRIATTNSGNQTYFNRQGVNEVGQCKADQKSATTTVKANRKAVPRRTAKGKPRSMTDKAGILDGRAARSRSGC